MFTPNQDKAAAELLRVLRRRGHIELLSRYRVIDVARKVVGVGSVGTSCWVVLRGAGIRRPAKGVKLGRGNKKDGERSADEERWGMSRAELERRILRLHKGGTGILKIGKALGIGTGTVQRVLMEQPRLLTSTSLKRRTPLSETDWASGEDPGGPGSRGSSRGSPALPGALQHQASATVRRPRWPGTQMTAP
jgi:hypothetical protein